MGSFDSAQEHEALLQSPNQSMSEGQDVDCQEDNQKHCDADLAFVNAELTLVPSDYQTLLAEVAQLQKLDQERCTRIHHLEKALDQALACLEELRSQVHDQQFLEIQLANTEDYASVQQQAIARLKLQLAEQQAALDAQILETQQRDQAIQELLATIESMTQAQQREVERLRSRLAQDQLEVQTHRSLLGKQLHDLQSVLESRQQRVCDLEGETLAARSLSSRLQGQLELAQQQIKDLSARLSQQRTQLVQLETQLEHSRLPVHPVAHAAYPVSGKRADTDPARAHYSSSSSGHSSWLKTPQQADQLEKRLGLQLAQQARWQQQHHDLETDRERLQNRVAEMEHQIAEMQEQILRQAQQETEYETAVQYWKDRYGNSQHQIGHLKELAEQLLLQSAAQELDPLLIDLLTALQLAPSLNQTEPQSKSQSSPPIPPLPLPRLTSVELPEFLVRRRAAQKNMNAAPL